MKKREKKLQINRETIRSMSGSELQEVGGGTMMFACDYSVRCTDYCEPPQQQL